MASRRALPIAFALLMGVPALAQGPTYGIGRTPTAEEIRARDISIGPTGEELPPGKGSAKEGALAYRTKGCAGCHGADGHRRHRADSEKQRSHESRRLGAGANPAASRAVRDDGLGLHQSRHAAQSRGNADPRRGLRADGVSALHQRRDPGGPGPRPAESAEGEDAARRQLRVAPGLEAEDAATKGLPLLARGVEGQKLLPLGGPLSNSPSETTTLRS